MGWAASARCFQGNLFTLTLQPLGPHLVVLVFGVVLCFDQGVELGPVEEKGRRLEVFSNFVGCFLLRQGRRDTAIHFAHTSLL